MSKVTDDKLLIPVPAPVPGCILLLKNLTISKICSASAVELWHPLQKYRRKYEIHQALDTPLLCVDLKLVQLLLILPDLPEIAATACKAPLAAALVASASTFTFSAPQFFPICISALKASFKVTCC